MSKTFDYCPACGSDHHPQLHYDAASDTYRGDEYMLLGINCPDWLNEWIDEFKEGRINVIVQAWWFGFVLGCIVTAFGALVGFYLAYN